jgi:hypothetical protein
MPATSPIVAVVVKFDTVMPEVPAIPVKATHISPCGIPVKVPVVAMNIAYIPADFISFLRIAIRVCISDPVLGFGGKGGK